MMKYNVYFGKNYLSFNMNDDSYTRRWIELVKDNLNHPDVKVWNPAVRRSTGEKDEAYYNTWATLKQSVDAVNKSGLFDKLLPDPTVSNLNELHYDFHKKCDEMSEGRAEGTNDPLLNKLNAYIHSCEHLEKTLPVGPSVNFQFAVVSGQTNKIKLPLEDVIEYCNKRRTNRDLTVGYHEIGKPTFDAYCTNDVNLLKNNDVVPFRNVSTETTFNMHKNKPDDWRYDVPVVRKKIYDWIQKNDLDKYNVEGNNIIIMRPILGSLDPEFTFDDVYDITREKITKCGFG